MAEEASVANYIATAHTVEQTAFDGGWDENQGAASRLKSQEGMLQLTQDLRKFSETLTCLKAVFAEEKDHLEQSLRVAAHERLGELLKVLKSFVNKYSELNSTGILNAAEVLINHIKNFNYESAEEAVPPEIFSAINNLAIAFSSSVSECLIGDINITPRHVLISSQPYENVLPHAAAYQRPSTFDGTTEIVPVTSTVVEVDNPETVEGVLGNFTENLEICFERAKAWSRYANDLLTYAKKKAHIELEYAKQLTKLSQGTRATLSEQSYLPFQSLYCTSLDNDKEYASRVTAMHNDSILAQKFIEPLQARRAEHDRMHKNLKDAWRKDKRWVEEAESNLKKAKQQYQTRAQDYKKAKEAASRADHHQQQQQQQVASTGDSGHSRQGSGVGSGQLALNVVTSGIISSNLTKAEKKKKQEEDSYQKANQAEINYVHWVKEANKRQKDIEAKELHYLKSLREMMTKCDETTKIVTLNYFSLHCQLMSPILVQHQALLDESKNYEPGFQYTEYLRHVSPQLQSQAKHDHQFELSSLDGASSMEPNAESSPMSHRASYGGRSLSTRRTSQRGFSDTESSSSRSMDDLSPSTSPADSTNRKGSHKRRRSTEGSLSSEEVLEEGKENVDQNRLMPPAPTAKDFATYSPDASPAPLRSQFQVPKVMKMVANVKEALKGIKRMPKSTIFGVDFSVASQDVADGIPLIVKKCVAEIDNRALTVKGIYRVNGVKNRIEKLCSLLDSPQCINADLSEQTPHDISGVLKYFLRQLPEPLMLYKLYDQFLEVAKEYSYALKEDKLAESLAPSAEETEAEVEPSEPRPNLDDSEEFEAKLTLVLEKMRTTVEKLPPPNLNTLQYVVAHLSRVAEHHNQTKMDASNLAIIFGPTLLRPMPSNESGNELQSLLELPSQSQAIEMLITHRSRIFNTSQNARVEEAMDQLSLQNGPNGTKELQILLSNHELDPATPHSFHINSPHIEPRPLVASTTVAAAGGHQPVPIANGGDVHTATDNYSTSGTSSSGDLYSTEDGTSRFGQKDSFSGESSWTSRSNGGMSLLDDGRKVIPHSPRLKKNSSGEFQGDILSAFLDGRNSIRNDISIKQAAPGTAHSFQPRVWTRDREPTRPLVPQSRRLGSSPTDQGHATTDRHSSTQEVEQRLRISSEGGGGVADAQADPPVIPLRLKSKRRSSDRGKLAGNELMESSAGGPISPHRPRSQQISGSAPCLIQDKKAVDEIGEQGTVGLVGALSVSAKSNAVKEHKLPATIMEDPPAIAGRESPQVSPVSLSDPTHPSSVTPSKAQLTFGMPGMTPPFCKALNWAYVKGNAVEIDASFLESGGSQRKIFSGDESVDSQPGR